jgi:hypothetical protein
MQEATRLNQLIRDEVLKDVAQSDILQSDVRDYRYRLKFQRPFIHGSSKGGG